MMRGFGEVSSTSCLAVNRCMRRHRDRRVELPCYGLPLVRIEF